MDAYVNYIFQISVHEWYTAFSSGFLKVCGGKVLELFQPSELRAMMVGSSNYNWEELEEVSIKGAIFFLPGSSGDLREVCLEPGLLPSIQWFSRIWRPPASQWLFLTLECKRYTSVHYNNLL